MHKQLIYISACALIAATSPGCSDRSASMQCSEFTFGSLDSICLGELTPLGIDVENMEIGAPSCMALADDTIMAVLDARGEYQVRLIDLKSGRAMNYVHVGEGGTR